MAEGQDSDTTQLLAEPDAPRSSRLRLAIRWMTPASEPVHLLIGAGTTIGRGADADIRIESAAVSRVHTKLGWEGPAPTIRDLDSRNGTYLNGQRIQHGVLEDGAVIRLGDAVGVVARVDPNQLADQGTELDGTFFGPDLTAALDLLRRAAPSDLPIVIVGETGVGKERAALAIHRLSRRPGAFQAVNCAALPNGLAEAELFGYRRGAFTGAEQASVGHVRAADNGTLLLDELADLAPPVQAKLLRVLQEKQVVPLGEVRPANVDLRVVAACQVPLAELVDSKRLRQDLAARLTGLTITLPPLRARRSDIGLLFKYFLARFAPGRVPLLDPKLRELLLLSPWPDNVRELELLTRRLLSLHGDEPMLKAAMLPERFELAGSERSPPSVRAVAPSPDRDQHDLQALRAELLVTDGNITRASANIGISRQRAYRLMRSKT